MNICPKNAKHFGQNECSEEQRKEWCDRVATEKKCHDCKHWTPKKKTKGKPRGGQGGLF